MATTTTNYGWDIPQSTDLVKDGATAIATLGQDIDTTFAELKGGTTNQLLAKNSNSDNDYKWAGAWTSYSPTLTNVTIGNGTVEAKYLQLGNLVFAKFKLTRGSTTSFTGTVGFSLPVTAADYGYNTGVSHLADAGANGYMGTLYLSSTTAGLLFVGNVSGTYNYMSEVTNTVPFAWGTSDIIYISYSYEAA